MREYAKLAPTFWTGSTGRSIRRNGPESTIVALYLISSPHSNMLGLFYQPLLYLAHETGLGIEGASKGLRSCIEAGFCRYDEATEMVFVPEMAAWQIGEALSSQDKRCKGIQKDYESLPECPFLGEFFDRYARNFHLQRKRGGNSGGMPGSGNSGSPFEGPSKPGAGAGAGDTPPNPPSGIPEPLPPAAVADPAPKPPAPPVPADPAGFALLPPLPPPPPAPTVAELFVRFWTAYPRKEGKGAAEKAFERAKPDEPLLVAMLASLAAWRQCEQWTKDRGQFVPHPSTWLNQRRWEDQPARACVAQVEFRPNGERMAAL